MWHNRDSSPLEPTWSRLWRTRGLLLPFMTLMIIIIELKFPSITSRFAWCNSLIRWSRVVNFYTQLSLAEHLTSYIVRFSKQNPKYVTVRIWHIFVCLDLLWESPRKNANKDFTLFNALVCFCCSAKFQIDIICFFFILLQIGYIKIWQVLYMSMGVSVFNTYWFTTYSASRMCTQYCTKSSTWLKQYAHTQLIAWFWTSLNRVLILLYTECSRRLYIERWAPFDRI